MAAKLDKVGSTEPRSPKGPGQPVSRPGLLVLRRIRVERLFSWESPVATGTGCWVGEGTEKQ